MGLSQERKNRFSKVNRLSKSFELYNCRKKGKKVEEDWLSISMFIRCSGTTKIRLGIVIKKKIFKKAVERNSFKRIVKETIRVNQDKFPEKSDIVVCIEKRPPCLNKKTYRDKLIALMSRLF